MRPGQIRVISGRQRIRLLAALGIAALVVMSLLAYLIWSGRENEIRAAETTTRNYAAIIETRLDATLRRIDAELQDQAHGIPSAAMNPHAVPRYAKTLNAELKIGMLNFPELAGFRIYDANGNRLYSADGDATPRTNISDREYFLRLRNNPHAGLVFSGNLASRTTGRPSMPVARALTDEHGVFLGIVSATIELDYFQKIFQSLDIGTQGTVAIYRSDDFTRIVRWPPGNGKANAALAPDSPTRAALRNGTRTATITISSSADGIVRIYSYHALDPYPFFTSVGMAHDDILAAWRARALGVGIGGLLLLGLLTGLLHRLWRTEESLRTNEEILRNTFE